MSTSVQQAKNSTILRPIPLSALPATEQEPGTAITPRKAQCTTSKQGRSLCRNVDEEVLDRVRAYYKTEAYQKARRKRAWEWNLYLQKANSGMAYGAFAYENCGA